MRKIHFIEAGLIILLTLSLILRYGFGLTNGVDILVFSLILGSLYCPLGFLTLRNSETTNYFLPIFLGFCYAIATTTFLFGALNVREFYLFFTIGVIPLTIAALITIYNLYRRYFVHYFRLHLTRIIILLMLNLFMLLRLTH